MFLGRGRSNTREKVETVLVLAILGLFWDSVGLFRCGVPCVRVRVRACVK